MNKKYQSGSAHLVITIILAVALIGILGFVYWQNFIQPKASDSKGDSSKTISPTKNPVSNAESLADWKTYTNTTYGFSFKYPSELYDVTTQANDRSSRPIGDGIILALDKNSGYTNDNAYAPLINVIAVDSSLSPEEYAKSLPVGDVTENGLVTISGVSVYKDTRQHMQIKYNEIYFSHNNKIIIMKLYTSVEDYSQTFEKMYGTLKFTN